MQQTSTPHPACERSAHLLAHRDLVVKTARRLRGRLPANVQMDELVQAGMIGLNDAMSRFEDRRTATFGTYASRRIEGAMLDQLRASDSLSRETRAQQRKVRAAVHSLEHQLGRAPRAKEVADTLGWTLEEFHRCMVEAGAAPLRKGDVAVDEIEHESIASTETTEDVIADEQADPLRFVQMRQRLEALSLAFKDLAERERIVMEGLYERGGSLKDVSVTLGVTESRVCQIHKAVIVKLRRRLRHC
jgi:RNA polymerase sigma factor for flagellar operon FliA